MTANERLNMSDELQFWRTKPAAVASLKGCKDFLLWLVSDGSVIYSAGRKSKLMPLRFSVGFRLRNVLH